MGTGIEMSKDRCSQPKGTNGGHDAHGLSDVGQNTWWVWCCGVLEGVERVPEWLLKEQKGLVMARPQLDNVLDMYFFWSSCKQLAELPKIRQINKYLFTVSSDCLLCPQSRHDD